jgi:pimeloyl-ACP methyl ester carboxylesterase
MLQRGIVYILPGIQGVDYHYKDIRNGLIGAGINCAIKIHPWGCQIPGLNLAVNETNVLGNRAWGKRIAKEIAAYQQQFPGRRIYMIGQSGGAGVSIFTAEALADLQAAPIEGLVLLDASVSNDYNLTKALSVCREGIVNFYNEKDTALLGFGTAVMGNVDGGHAPSAGRVGFKGQYPKLYNVRIRPDMIDDFADPHFADCSQAFASQYLAPWIIDHSWPPGHLQLGMAK